MTNPKQIDALDIPVLAITQNGEELPRSAQRWATGAGQVLSDV
jgi:hypothetical protein